MNGYFQLICDEENTELCIYPPTEDGEPVSVVEIGEYLNNRTIGYMSGALRTITAGQEPYTLLLDKETRAPLKESYKLMISPDNMSVTARFYAPAKQGELLNKEEFIDELAIKNVRYGIQDDILNEFFCNRRYCEDIIVAKGIEPRHGTDAYIEYYFTTELSARPTLKEDGSVDFFNLNTISLCKKGDVIARLFPEDAGEPGTNVLGERVRGRDVKKKYLKYGRNITISEDKMTMISEVDGHVTLVEEKVFVSDILTVENVDNSTGNIKYEGSVQINGNVCTNFAVIAKGNIEVRGVVEGAYIESGGDIIIARGINGMSKGILKAGGNIVTKYMENTTAVAGGYISSNSILHSVVQAGDEITVSGKRGFITGGRVSATNKVTVKTLGSSMGADTIVEVGSDPNIKMRIQELQKKVGEANKVMKSVQPILTATQQKLAKGVKLTPEQVSYMKSLLMLNQAKIKEVEENTAQIEDLQKNMGKSVNAQVIVTGVVFQGTRICIGDLSMVVHFESQYCKFIKVGGEVKMTGL